jgi:transposase
MAMATTAGQLARWLKQAGISPERLTAEQMAVVQAAYQFRQQTGEDYYSNRMLGHFLLNCGSGLKVAQIARLLKISRPTASRQQGLSSKEVIQAGHHRMAGRSHGKLLPRYAGPIAEFVLTTHPKATHYDTLDFIERTWGVRVSTVALHKFLKKYGLDRASRAQALAAANEAAAAEPQGSGAPDVILPAVRDMVPPGQPVPLPPAPFLSRPRTTRGPSC